MGDAGQAVAELGMVQRDLRMLPDRRDRRPQLVRGVRNEPAFSMLRLLQPVQHPVHRRGQPAHLVAGGRLRHSAVQRRRGDGVDLDPDRVDRSQRPPDQSPGGRGHHRQQGRQPDRQQRFQRAGGLVHRVHALPEHDGPARPGIGRHWPGTGRHRTAHRSPATPRRQPHQHRQAGRVSSWPPAPHRRTRGPGTCHRRRQPPGHPRSPPV